MSTLELLLAEVLSARLLIDFPQHSRCGWPHLPQLPQCPWNLPEDCLPCSGFPWSFPS